MGFALIAACLPLAVGGNREESTRITGVKDKNTVLAAPHPFHEAEKAVKDKLLVAAKNVVGVSRDAATLSGEVQKKLEGYHGSVAGIAKALTSLIDSADTLQSKYLTQLSETELERIKPLNVKFDSDHASLEHHKESEAPDRVEKEAAIPDHVKKGHELGHALGLHKAEDEAADEAVDEDDIEPLNENDDSSGHTDSDSGDSAGAASVNPTAYEQGDSSLPSGVSMYDDDDDV